MRERTPRSRLTGAESKPPQAAWDKSPCRERCGKGIKKMSGRNQGRRTIVNCRSSVESAQKMSKPGGDVNLGSTWQEPVYGPCGIRHRGSVSLIRASRLNCGNLRQSCQGKGTSIQREADSTKGQPRDGATRSSEELSVMERERRSSHHEAQRTCQLSNRRSMSV